MNAHVSPAQETPKTTAAYEDPALYGGLDEPSPAVPFPDADAEDEDEDPLVLELTTPYTFGGVTYEKLDLHGLEEIGRASCRERV